MIHSHDRSDWFGASDTDYIVGNWNTKTFKKWWLVKLGLITEDFQNVYTRAGTEFEHKILDSLGFPIEKDRQYLCPFSRLRVNLDGNTSDTVHEIKTFKACKGYRLPKKHWRQVQVQMYGSGFRHGKLHAYPLTDDDYRNFFRPVDASKILTFDIPYDRGFIESEYRPKLIYLSQCLRKGIMPDGTKFSKS